MNIIFISRVVNNLKANVAMVHMVEVDKEKLWMTFAGKTNKENGVLIVDGGCNTTVCGNGFRSISTSNRKASLVGFAEDKVENNVPIDTTVTAVDLPDGTAFYR